MAQGGPGPGRLDDAGAPDDAGPPLDADRKLPPDFRLALDPGLRRPRREVLIGGAPIRVLRLTRAGADLVDRWSAGVPVGSNRGAQALASRLLDAGLAHPRPRPGSGPPSESVVIVVPVRDDPAGLGDTVESLRATAPGVEVIVVDDDSCIPVAGAALGASGVNGAGVVRVVRRAGSGGPAAARNSGREAVAAGIEEGDPSTSEQPPAPAVVVFVDAGCVLSDGWLPTLLRHFADPGVAAVAPRVRSRASASTPRALAAYEARHSSLDLGPAESLVRPFSAVPYVPTAVLAVRLTAFDSIGRFDESLRYGEDVDLVWRLTTSGWSVRYDPSAEATHPARSSMAEWIRQRFYYGRSATPLAARHGRAVAPAALSPWSAAVWALVVSGHPASGAAVAALSAGVLARRAGGDSITGAELARLATVGHIRAAGTLAAAVRRAWLPPFVAAAAAVALTGRSRRATGLRATGLRTTRLRTSGLRTTGLRSSGQRARGLGATGLGAAAAESTVAVAAAAALVGGSVWEWCRARPPVGPVTWVGLALADDLAYQTGVWSGAVRGRSWGALLPKW